MRTRITQLSETVVVIESEISLPVEQIKIVVDGFKHKGFEVIWLQI